MRDSYDVIVIGGGHAGCEAAMAASALGSSVLLISMDTLAFAKMSCNPAVGGIAKGQIVREIDALGGWTGIITDRSTLQFRMLNRSKGPAMWSPRAQCDKIAFSLNWKRVLFEAPRLDICEDIADKFLFVGGSVSGVHTVSGRTFYAGAIILTAGTFLGGKTFIGMQSRPGGRIGESPSYGLTEQLKSLGIKAGRMKTGTPPRIDITSVDTASLPLQLGDSQPRRFSFLHEPSKVQREGRQLPCYILHTNERVHDILRSGFSESPMFTGMIHGRGPRYCPSIEDKLRVFPDKTSHQLFLEPEAERGNEYYLQGFSSSLPLKVQIDALHAIEGMENARIFRPAYAVEYDYFDPLQLSSSLEMKTIPGLFLAGQVNGTTGYEEAAGQGIMAGINAYLRLVGKDPFVLHRDEAYIGVLIDDLVTKGVDEPYRMFTSRSEYRILLRQDNADERLTPRSYAIGLASEERMKGCDEKRSAINKLNLFCYNTLLKPSEVNPYLSSVGSSAIAESKKIAELDTRPEVSLKDLLSIVPCGTKKNYSYCHKQTPSVDDTASGNSTSSSGHHSSAAAGSSVPGSSPSSAAASLASGMESSCAAHQSTLPISSHSSLEPSSSHEVGLLSVEHSSAPISSSAGVGPSGLGFNSLHSDTLSSEVIESVEIGIRYKGYLERELRNAEKLHHLENLKIPSDFDFSRVMGLSIECRQKLAKYKPLTIAQASRISGVSPSDISVLLVYFGR